MTTDARQHEAMFALRSLRAAKVSEISEATAAAPVAPEQRINFHIGTPVLDDHLIRLYQRLIFGLPTHVDEPTQDPLEQLFLSDPH